MTARKLTPREQLEAAVWKAIPRDYRSVIGGRRSIMLPASMGGGLAFLDALGDEWLRRLAPQRREGAR